MKIEGNFGNLGEYYPGILSNYNEDGTYNIDYDNGEKETGVPTTRIRKSVRPSLADISGTSRALKTDSSTTNSYDQTGADQRPKSNALLMGSLMGELNRKGKENDATGGLLQSLRK